MCCGNESIFADEVNKLEGSKKIDESLGRLKRMTINSIYTQLVERKATFVESGGVP